MQTSTMTRRMNPAPPHGVDRNCINGGNPGMTPFVEVPLDPNWPDIVRTTIAAQPDTYFQLHFDGRIPSPQEKLEFIELAAFLLTPIRVFQNNIYRVEILNTPPMTPTYIHLCIERLDKGTCNEWADMQRIKNEIVGPDYEAVELFPSESRLVNTGNQYHLWVHSNPSYRFPIGWARRLVLSEPLKICTGPLRSAGLLDKAASQAPIPVGTFKLTPAGRRG